MVMPIANTGIQTAKYCNVAGLGVLIFDYFLTLEPECCKVRWTWNGRWNITRVLFIISRYMAFVAAGMTSYAAIATRANEDVTIHIITIVAAEGLLIIRTYVFWKQSKKLLVVLLVLAAISIACAVSIAEVVNNVVAPADPSDGNLGFKAPHTSNCTFQAGRSSAIQYGFLVAYELCKDISSPSHLSSILSTVLMSLMMFKRYQDYRDSDSRLVRAVFQGGMRMSRVEALVPVVSVVNIVIMSVVPASYDMMMDVPQLVLHSMLASRVLFVLRESDQDESDGGTLQMSTFRPAQRNQYTSFD
ncbi:uncharacterized protein BJ212DRAFT_1302652 [Suillus subaureus]|uniref:DUF6533 domain-containing protein n=1 Tax=Suillus subaureus TaxID=48587 RepID=A0A9P7E2R6_9AGAM|nr:uncharacterized protein BJ212DRAFT_1302652 [Suillus subaureus]KAG1809449.1 hypothetical protein BJ212DRAFT_1302652 [Suillus subaureus]